MNVTDIIQREVPHHVFVVEGNLYVWGFIERVSGSLKVHFKDPISDPVARRIVTALSRTNKDIREKVTIIWPISGSQGRRVYGPGDHRRHDYPADVFKGAGS